MLSRCRNPWTKGSQVAAATWARAKRNPIGILAACPNQKFWHPVPSIPLLPMLAHCMFSGGWVAWCVISCFFLDVILFHLISSQFQFHCFCLFAQHSTNSEVLWTAMNCLSIAWWIYPKKRDSQVLCFLCCFLFHRIAGGRLQGYKGATLGLDRNIKTQAINSIKQPHTYIHRMWMCHLFLTCVARLPELHGFYLSVCPSDR